MAMGSGNDQNLEKRMQKQMGCMAGFFHLFDRHQILTGRRLSSSKRLSSYTATDAISEPEISVPTSPAISREFSTPSPEPPVKLAAPEVLQLPPKSPLPHPIFNLKEGFHRESPRLSLDSRATTDAKGGLHPRRIRTSAAIISPASRCDSLGSDTSDGCQNRSPSVIARLMGLEPLPNSSDSETEKKPELRRSASESRASRDLFHSRFNVIDGNNFPIFHNNTPIPAHYADPGYQPLKNTSNAQLSSKISAPQQRKGFFASVDISPEAKQNTTFYGEIEKRLKVRGIDEPTKDLERLKQILETLQLKGLLHSKNPSNQVCQRRIFVYDESPIVVMQPSRPNSRDVGDYLRVDGRIQGRNHAFSCEISHSISHRRAGKSPRPKTRNECNACPKRSNSIVKPKPLSVEIRRRQSELADNQRVSPINSPKLNKRTTCPDPTANNGSPRSHKTTAKTNKKEKIATVANEEGESSSVSGSSISASTDTERWKTVECREERNLLERCDKLLQSIGEMNGSETQPSPVSVLDSSFYKDEPLTPPTVTTRRILHFKDESGELEEETWRLIASSTQSKCQEETCSDGDYAYVSDILRAAHSLPEDSDIFMLLEKQQYLKGKDTSKASRLQRKLIFDATNEILERNRRLPPWKIVSWTNYNVKMPHLDEVWSELQRFRDHNAVEDLFEVICGVLSKDLAGDELTGWGGDYSMEMSETVLDIERLIFKDLVNLIIQDVAALASSRSMLSPIMSRRKLVF